MITLINNFFKVADNTEDQPDSKTLVSKVQDLCIDPRIIDSDHNYELPGYILRQIHDLIIQEFYSPSEKPEFSQVLERKDCLVLEPLYSKSKKVEKFLNNGDDHEIYYAKILYLIIRDYPFFDPNQKIVCKIKAILDLMKIHSTKGKIKDDIGSMKVYFKSVRPFFFSLKPSTTPLPATDSIFVDILIERSTSSRYMVVPYSDYAWGKNAKSNVVFIILYDGKLFQSQSCPISSGKDGSYTPLQVMSYWAYFLKLHLQNLKKGRTLYYSKYYQKQECFETQLLANYQNEFQCVAFNNFGYGLSPIHHIKKLKRADDYDVNDLNRRCLSCWNGNSLSVTSLLENRILEKSNFSCRSNSMLKEVVKCKPMRHPEFGNLSTAKCNTAKYKYDHLFNCIKDLKTVFGNRDLKEVFENDPPKLVFIGPYRNGKRCYFIYNGVKYCCAYSKIPAETEWLSSPLFEVPELSSK